jgi:hypothetical protein
MPSLLKKAVFIIAVILVYFFGVRELRKLPLQWAQNEIQTNLAPYLTDSSPVTVMVYTEINGSTTKLAYIIPFGFYFLAATIGLIIIGAPVQSYKYLAYIHTLDFVIATLCLFFAMNIHINFMVVTDIIASYLSPVASISVIALTLVQKKERNAITG